MVQITINREAGKMILQYPAQSGKTYEEIPLKSNRDAMGIWRLRVRNYAMDTMMKYAYSRTKALAHVMTAERQQALREIRSVMLDNYEGKDLTYFLLKVMKLSREVVAVAPSTNSKHLDYYETVILPMYHWINQYLRKSASL